MIARQKSRPASTGGVALVNSVALALVARLAERGTVVAYPRNAVIQTEGTPGTGLGLVLSGRLKVYVGGEPHRELRLDTLVPGECFGIATIEGGRCTASVRTMTPAKLCLLTLATVDKLIASDRHFAKYLMHHLILRTRSLTAALRAMALEDVRDRVFGLLREMSHDEAGEIVVRPRPRQIEIAERIGASPGMVNRVVKRMLEDGCITSRATCIVVHGPPPHPRAGRGSPAARAGKAHRPRSGR